MKNTLKSFIAVSVLSLFTTHAVAAAKLPGDDVGKAKSKKVVEGLEFFQLKEGAKDAKAAKSGQEVAVDYTGWLITGGEPFDSSKGREPIKFKLGAGRVIAGWDKGLEGMKVGERRKLVIQPKMGYGERPMGPIPANSVLVFDVELKDVQ